ncbi:MAG: hypothetical protein ACRD5L_03290, partial [Bryobacteraceae bacterium]
MGPNALANPPGAKSPREESGSLLERGRANAVSSAEAARAAGSSRKMELAPQDATEAAVSRFLRSFQALLVSTRLYQKNHPLLLASLEAADMHLRATLERVAPVAVGVENGAIVFCRTKGAEPAPLESKEAWETLAEDWTRRGIRSLLFLPQTNLGELDAFARLLNATRPHLGTDWAARLAEQRVFGIRANV